MKFAEFTKREKKLVIETLKPTSIVYNSQNCPKQIIIWSTQFDYLLLESYWFVKQYFTFEWFFNLQI